VAGQHDEWPPSQEPIDDLLVPDQRDPFAPGRQVQLARDVEDLHQHHAEVLIHPANDLVTLGLGVSVAERQFEVLQADVAVPPVHSVEDGGQEPGEGI
jgi:hypothetical protein